MRKYLAVSIMILASLCVFSVCSYAGSSASTGNVSAVILCHNAEGTAIVVDTSEIAIQADSCNCNVTNSNAAVGCEAGENTCTECITSLLRGGLSVKSANGYFDSTNDIELQHYVLTGVATPFITRYGCFCN